MSIYTEQNGYKILKWEKPLAGKKLAVVSDLHIGNPGSFYEKPWTRLKEGIENEEFDAVLINGDLADGLAYFQTGAHNHLTQLIQSRIEELLEQTPHVPVIITLGNHDLSQAYQHMLAELTQKYPDRLYVCDAALMADAVFVHGDFTNHRPCEKNDISKRLNDESRTRLVKHNNVEDYHATARLVSAKLKKLFSNGYDEICHIFVGHFHPKQPFRNLRIPREYADNKTYHMTGCSKDDKISTILQVHFDGQGVSRVDEIFRQDRNFAGGVVTPREDRIAAAPAR